MLRLPSISTKARFLLIGYGFILLIWMSLEDSGTLSVSILGVGASIFYLGFAILKRIGGRDYTLQSWFIAWVSIGILLGAVAPIATAILMFFKSGWHGHSFPDYPPNMIAAMLGRVPAWSFAGALIGLALSIFSLLRQHSKISD